MTIAEKLIQEGMEKGLEQGMQQGIQKGKIEEKREMAKKLFSKGMDLFTIVEITGLSENEAKKLM